MQYSRAWHLSYRRLAAWLLAFLVSAVCTTTPGAQRALQIVAPTGEAVGVFTASYALVIGASQYTNGWTVLPGVTQDIAAVHTALEAQGFEVTMVRDPTAQALHEAFTTFITRYGLVPEHRLLIYFAGHGHTVQQSYGEAMGYIVPVDAPNPHQNTPGFLAAAMDMQQIETYAKRMQARHVLFLFDSCFSGSIFSLSRAVPEHISYKTSNPVRQFITSGSAAEQVPDESIFRQQLLTALQGAGDVNGDGYVTGTELGEFLQGAVINYSKGAQHPQYGKIRNPHLDKGDFVFKIDRPSVTMPLQGTKGATMASREMTHTAPGVTAGTTVPEVRGQTVSQAQQILTAQQLAGESAGSRPVPLVAVNTVVDQEPRPGTRVQPGTVVKLVVGTQESLARELITQATALRTQLAQRDPEEQTMYWWALLARKGRADLLQRSVLLAVEAQQRFPAPETEEALHRGLALLTRPAQRLEHDGQVQAVVFSPAGTYLATASADHTARVWEVIKGQQVARLPHDGSVEDVAFSPDGRLLATASADNTSRLWEVAGGRQVRRLAHQAAVKAVAFSRDGRFLATASADHIARVWEVASGRQVVQLAHEVQVRLVTFSPDGTLLATAGGALSTPAESNTALVWAVGNGQVISRLRHEKGIHSLAFQPHGTHLATASADATVRLWAPSTGQEVRRFAHKSSVLTVAFSSDGRQLATGGQDATARLWEIESGRELARASHGDTVNAVAFRPDGAYLVTGSQDTTARVWETSHGLEAARLSRQQPVRTVAISADGASVATAGGHDIVEVWEAWPADLPATACSRVSRNFTLEEWRQYLGDEPYRKTCARLP